MYLRRHSRKKGDTEYEAWSLVESVRTAKGPRQRTVATLGKLPGLDKEERVGWEEIARVLDGKPRPERSLLRRNKRFLHGLLSISERSEWNGYAILERCILG